MLQEILFIFGIVCFLVFLGYLLFFCIPVDYSKNILRSLPDIANTQAGIPKKLSMTYHKIDKIPSKVYQNLETYASDYKYTIFDDEKGYDFINKYFTDNVAEKFTELIGAHKADLLRYCIMYIDGGVYMDIKTELVEPLSKTLVAPVETFLSEKVPLFLINSKHTPNSIYNGFIATPPGKKLFLNLINFIVQTKSIVPKMDYHVFVKNMYDEVLKDFKGKDEAKGFVSGIDNDYYFFEEVSCKKEECADGLDRYGLCVWIKSPDGRPVIKTRYADYPWN
jgi:Glycosyltransferase sugar-binding region containing DXD motif